MKKILVIFLVLTLSFSFSLNVFAENDTNSTAEILDVAVQNQPDLGIECRGAVLMEAETGKVLYELEGTTEGFLASVTKVMTLLLCMEAIDKGQIRLEDTVTVSTYAASMGGSQVFLEEGENFSVQDLIKCTVISSANDAAVALAETVGGSESGFVSMMNEKAKELGLSGTHFENVTGLDDDTTDHKSCALDIAVMSRELIKHPLILKYSSLWQDSIRDGQFILTNTNRLVRFYRGCNGLKTGSTSKAGYCVSVTAERDGMTLIAVVMGAESRDKRNEIARTLLDYGFSNYELYRAAYPEEISVPLRKGLTESVSGTAEKSCLVVKKGTASKIQCDTALPEYLVAPVELGEKIGEIRFRLGEETLFVSKVTAAENAPKITFADNFLKMIKQIVTGEK